MANNTDIAGVERLREIDQQVIRNVWERARMNNLSDKDSVYLIREAAAAGRRCQERLEREARTVHSDQLNLAIERTSHQYLVAVCERIREETAALFHTAEPATTPLAEPLETDLAAMAA